MHQEKKKQLLEACRIAAQQIERSRRQLEPFCLDTIEIDRADSELEMIFYRLCLVIDSIEQASEREASLQSGVPGFLPIPTTLTTHGLPVNLQQIETHFQAASCVAGDCDKTRLPRHAFCQNHMTELQKLDHRG